MKEMINDPGLSLVSNPACTAPYDTDERASSPLSDNVYTRDIQVIKHKAPALGLMCIEGLKATRKTLGAGSVGDITVSKALKDHLRIYSERKEIQPVAQSLSSTATSNANHNFSSADNGSSEKNTVVEKRQGDEGSEEDDEEQQCVQENMIWNQSQGGEGEEEKEGDELLERGVGRGIVKSLGAEEEHTADYSNCSGHAGDKSNSESGNDSGGDGNNNDCIK